MKNRFKNIVAVALVIVLLLPMGVKMFDGTFHHHHCSSSNAFEKESIKHSHDDCEILNFEFSFYPLGDVLFYSPIINRCSDFLPTLLLAKLKSNLKYTSQLRGPPYFQK